MMKKLFGVAVLSGLLTILCASASATELVFQFRSPSFVGGDSFNGAFLLSKAQSQNGHTKKRAPVPERDQLQEFADSLQRQVLFRLSRELINRTFGESGAFDEDGSYEVGGFQIDIISNIEGIQVTITDMTKGNSTVINPNCAIEVVAGLGECR